VKINKERVLSIAGAVANDIQDHWEEECDAECKTLPPAFEDALVRDSISFIVHLCYYLYTLISIRSTTTTTTTSSNGRVHVARRAG
jgi:hypothetical protein